MNLDAFSDFNFWKQKALQTISASLYIDTSLSPASMVRALNQWLSASQAYLQYHEYINIQD